MIGSTGVDLSGFDDVTTGLGTILFTTSNPGNNSFLAFFDHDIDPAVYWDESGSVTGTPIAGQSWEIDEPGWSDGDIVENFTAGSLDNGIGTSIHGNTEFPDDVSMAMGWDFFLAAGETATITLTLSEQMPPSGFFLTQWDMGTETGFYFSGNLDIRSDEQAPVPEPATMLLFGTGLAGLAGASRRRSKK